MSLCHCQLLLEWLDFRPVKSRGFCGSTHKSWFPGHPLCLRRSAQPICHTGIHLSFSGSLYAGPYCALSYCLWAQESPSSQVLIYLFSLAGVRLCEIKKRFAVWIFPPFPPPMVASWLAASVTALFFCALQYIMNFIELANGCYIKGCGDCWTIWSSGQTVRVCGLYPVRPKSSSK